MGIRTGTPTPTFHDDGSPNVVAGIRADHGDIQAPPGSAVDPEGAQERPTLPHHAVPPHQVPHVEIASHQHDPVPFPDGYDGARHGDAKGFGHVTGSKVTNTSGPTQSRLAFPVTGTTLGQHASIPLLDAMMRCDTASLEQQISALRASKSPLVMVDGTPLLVAAAAQNADPRVIACLIDAGCPVNAQDRCGNTALICAATAGNASTVALLIQLGADVRIKNKDKISAVAYAYMHRYTEIETILTCAGALHPFPLKRGQSIRKYRHAAKAELLKHPVNILPRDVRERLRMPSTPEALESQMFAPEASVRGRLIGEMEMLYTLHPSLRPMMDLAALGALGLHRARGSSNPTSKQKKLNILLVPEVSMMLPGGDVMPNGLMGLYTGKNTIIVEANDASSLHGTKHTLVHEAFHWCIGVVFDNEAKPYKSDDKGASDRFQSIVHATRARLPHIPQEGHENRTVHALLAGCFVGEYDERHYAAELIVRVPQIIAACGEERGTTWLRTYVPELWTYYQDHVQPAIFQFLSDHDADHALCQTQQTSDADVGMGADFVMAKKEDWVRKQAAQLMAMERMPTKRSAAALKKAVLAIDRARLGPDRWHDAESRTRRDVQDSTRFYWPPESESLNAQYFDPPAPALPDAAAGPAAEKKWRK